MMPNFNKSKQRRFTSRFNTGQSQGRQQRDDETRDRIQQNQNVQQQRQSIAKKPTFGKSQSSVPKTIGSQQRTPKTIGRQQRTYAKKPQASTAKAPSRTPNARVELPNLDDINDEFGGRVRRQITYEDHYGTTDAVSNKLKDKYKRSKLRKKKGTGLLGTVDTKSGNSVLDAYKNLGKKLTR